MYKIGLRLESPCLEQFQTIAFQSEQNPTLTNSIGDVIGLDLKNQLQGKIRPEYQHLSLDIDFQKFFCKKIMKNWI